MLGASPLEGLFPVKIRHTGAHTHAPAEIGESGETIRVRGGHMHIYAY
jgi:hypothetical protein